MSEGCEFCKEKHVTAFGGKYLVPNGGGELRGVYVINNRGIDKIGYYNGTRKIDLVPISYCPFCGRKLNENPEGESHGE